MIAHLQKVCPGSLGTYVISMATVASDVLAVVLLQRECGGDPAALLNVAPLFERLDDLRDGPAQLKRLFSVPWYHTHIKGKQEVMIGYSDSGKDARASPRRGRCTRARRWPRTSATSSA